MAQVRTVRLIGPGGAGKSTTGSLLAQRLDCAFLDLDLRLADRIGDIGAFIDRHGYAAYARENVETYRRLMRSECGTHVVALSSGFMTYPDDVHPDYERSRRHIGRHADTFVLLPSLDHDVCVAETVRRQIARPFGRSAAREEAVIRSRFHVYMAVPATKIATMRLPHVVVDEILAALTHD